MRWKNRTKQYHYLREILFLMLKQVAPMITTVLLSLITFYTVSFQENLYSVEVVVSRQSYSWSQISEDG